jgi:hypothetical protein
MKQMGINQNKFPFKYFLSIINTLENENTLPAWQIAKFIGSCISDASEVTRMLHYLTHYGKIVSNPEGKWKIVKNKMISDPPSKKFRANYIKQFITLIERLTSEPQSLEELGEELSLELDEIRNFLSYLSLLTEKGYIQLEGSGPRQQWSLKPWL